MSGRVLELDHDTLAERGECSVDQLGPRSGTGVKQALVELLWSQTQLRSEIGLAQPACLERPPQHGLHGEIAVRDNEPATTRRAGVRDGTTLAQAVVDHGVQAVDGIPHRLCWVLAVGDGVVPVREGDELCVPVLLGHQGELDWVGETQGCSLQITQAEAEAAHDRVQCAFVQVAAMGLRRGLHGLTEAYHPVPALAMLAIDLERDPASFHKPAQAPDQLVPHHSPLLPPSFAA